MFKCSVKRKITDLILFICFCALAGTGILLYLAPKGVEWSAMGVHEDAWKYAHIASGALMFAAMVAHLLINKKWVAGVGTSNRKWLVWALCAAGAVLIIAPALAPIKLI